MFFTCKGSDELVYESAEKIGPQDVHNHVFDNDGSTSKSPVFDNNGSTSKSCARLERRQVQVETDAANMLVAFFYGKQC
jgi:hypothetical protein